MTRTLSQAALVVVLLMPWFLVHVRAAAEIGIDLVAAGFLVHAATTRWWAWLAAGWLPIALAWWLWLIVCTLIDQPGWHGGLLQAALMVRFLVFTAALEHWVLRDERVRRWFMASLAAAALYIASQTLLQFATGYNLFGNPRSGDGELTGPFDKPRDAPTFVRLLFPVLLPPVGWLLARRRWAAHLAGIGLVVGVMAVTVLIGQRMPLVLAVLGLVVAGSFLPRLRTPALIAVLVAGTLVAATVVVSPPTFYRLVTKFTQQMEGFGASPYGLLAERNVAIIEQHPWTGRGYDGYAQACRQPRYYLAWHWPGEPAPPDPTGASLCLTHPHNLYLQAATDAGLPGLALFCLLVWTWLRRLAHGLLRYPDPLRVGLFTAAFIQLWPIASTSPLISLPIGGWFFLLLGLGLAAANAYMDRQTIREPACQTA